MNDSKSPAIHESSGIRANTWWPLILASCVVALGCAALAADASDEVLAGALGIVVASIVLSGLWGLGRIVPILAMAAVPAVFVYGNVLDDRAYAAVILACVAAVSGWASGHAARRERVLSKLLAVKHPPASRATDRAANGNTHSENGFEHEFQRAQRYGRTVTVAVVCIDNLHTLRAEKGEAAAQDAIEELSELFSADSRLPDCGAEDSDRLVFVFPETQLLGARVVAERIRINFQKAHVGGDEMLPLTVSAGIASFPEDGENSRAILAACESALANAVDRGGNRTILSHSPEGIPAGWSA